MASESRTADLDPLFRLLVAYRSFVYLGGLLVISLPLFLSVAFDVEPPATVRAVVVTVSLAIMVVTYVGERRVGHDHIDPRTGQPTEAYSLRMRVALALAVVGIAVGIYVALEVNSLAGTLFVLGAYLFGYLGYRGETNADDDTDGG